ncbi:bestrophin family protein [Nevskia ramosa]|uniref:bestrophin family protein n=1 Tax=Nevskia ramosa TaxID=64002 RepID=UPI0003B4D9DE|nr:bestrophin family ion channel [Nevskia ramosa]
MIVRPRPHWFRMLFIWRGSVLRKLVGRLLTIGLISVSAELIHLYVDNNSLTGLNAQPFSLIGLALAIFLGFRTNVSHARYWDARKLWGSIMNASRALARQTLTLTEWPAKSDDAQRFVRTLIAHSHALRHQLRATDPSDDLRRLLATEDLPRVLEARWKPIVILQLLGSQLHTARRHGASTDVLALAMENNLQTLGDAVGGCEAIHGTPIPLTFSVLVHRTIYFYCTLLPFALVGSIGWYTPVFAMFVAYTFMALEAIAEELESPFGIDDNDLALEAICDSIEASLLETLGEPLPPTKTTPKDFVLR